MPQNFQDYSDIKWKILGISNLKARAQGRAQDSAIDRAQEQVKSEWDRFFCEPDTVWLDVSSNETTEEIGRRLLEHLNQSQITFRNGEAVILAFFLDLSRKLNEAEMEHYARLMELPTVLAANLGYRISLVPVFGWVGQTTFIDHRPDLRHNAQALASCANTAGNLSRKVLCLVGDAPLRTDDFSWKAAILFLDVLRRQASPEIEIPAPGAGDHIGFLRYGEFNEAKLKSLQRKLNDITQKLSNSGAEDFEKLLNADREEIKQIADKLFPVSYSFQPLHPHLFVKDCFSRWRARRGLNKEYEAARQATRRALSQTALKLEKGIMDACALYNESARLVWLLSEAKVGLQLEQDSDKIQGMICKRKQVSSPRPPELCYDKKGIGKETENYLALAHTYAENCAVLEYEQCLWKAYQELSPEERAEREKSLESGQRRIAAQISVLLPEQDLLSHIQRNENMPESCFSPAIPGGDSYRVAVVNSEDYCQAVYDACNGTLSKPVYYRANNDGAPMKGLQFFVFQCDEARLVDLLGN